MINNIIGEKTIDLSYPIHLRREIAVVSMFSDNVRYEMTEPLVLKLMGNDEKRVPNWTYTIRELNALVERKFTFTDLGSDPPVIKTNKLEKITDIIFNLDKLDDTSNLEDGKPSNTLFTYYMPGLVNFMHFKPKIPQYKKLKSEKIVSLTLRITDQNGNMITNGLGTTVVLHIQ